MTLSRFALLPLLIVILSACGLPETSAPSMLATPTMMAEEVVAAMEPTAQSSPTPVPTQNAPATVAAMEMTAASDNLKAANVEATAIVVAAQIAANAASTQAAVDLLMMEKSEAGQTNRALIALTAQAMEVAAKQAEAKIIEGQNKAEQIRQDGQTMLIKQIMGWIVAVLAVVFVGVILWRLATERRAPADDSADDDEADDAPLPEFVAGVKTALFAHMATPGELRKVGRAVLNGRPFSHAQIVRTMGIMTETNFDFLQSEFVIRGLATWRNAEHHKQGCMITPKGNQFFVDIGCQTTSPLPEPAATLQNQPVKDTIRQDDSGLGQGGGWIVTQEKP